MTHKSDYLFQVGMTVIATVQKTQVTECLHLHTHQHACQNLFPQDGISLESIGHHIVYVFNEYHITIQSIQITDKSTMSTGTEQQFTIIGTEGSTILVGSYCIRGWELFTQRYMISNVIAFLKLRYYPLEKFFKEFPVF